MSIRNPNEREDEAQKALCPQCGATNLETVQVEESFDHGGRKKPIRVTALLPVKRCRCRECGFTFEDWETEKARHQAACAKVGVQTPDEIRSLRKAHGLSQKEFARLTRLGAATLNRWERGHLIQNGAYDDYLYLLRFPGNLDRLRERRRLVEESDSDRFRCLQLTPELHRRKQQFRLTAARRPIGAVGNRANLERGGRDEEGAATNACPSSE